MRVYRVERKGHGPYRNPDGSAERWGINGYSSDRCPTPENDGLYVGGHYRYGFRSLRQFKSWFVAEDRRNLAKHRFKLAKYVLPKEHVKMGKRQLAFNPRHAKRIELKKIT